MMDVENSRRSLYHVVVRAHQPSETDCLNNMTEIQFNYITLKCLFFYFNIFSHYSSVQFMCVCNICTLTWDTN